MAEETKDEQNVEEPETANAESAENGAVGGSECAEEPEVRDSHGQPGINKERHDREVKALNDRIAELTAKLDEAAESKKGREDLKAEIDKLNNELATERTTSKLEKAGCIDTETALLIIDRYEGDVSKLKDAKPFLFETVKKGATGFKPSGAADDLKAELNKARLAMGVKPKD